jgi:hypothetical protein
MRRSLHGPVASSALALAVAAGLAGCDPFTATAFGVGASTAVSHTLTGITYRTFTAPMERVRSASVGALNRMGMKVARTEKNGDTLVLKASAREREIEVELEPLTPSSTRMRVVARNGGILYDSATATEIILQTEKILGSA